MANVEMKKFIECHFPTKACNFKCDYCYVTQNKWWSEGKPDFTLCLNNVEQAFSQDRLGGPCMVNICATGETLLFSESIEIIKKILLNGHYVMVVSNGTITQRFIEISKFDEELRKRLFLKLSFHYLELKRMGWLEKYFDNIRIIQNAGISFTVEITPDDEYIPYINEIKQVCMENLGALCHVTVCRDERLKGYPLLSKLPMHDFIDTWKCFDSKLFDYKSSIFSVKRREYCYAGKWSMVVDLGSGDYKQCYKGKKLGNIYDFSRPLKFYAVGNHCHEGHCFNGHAFLGFGLIPGLDTVDYADMRDREGKNGHWLQPEMDSFMRTKLINSNKEDSSFEKLISNIKSTSIKSFVKSLLKK